LLVIALSTNHVQLNFTLLLTPYMRIRKTGTLSKLIMREPGCSAGVPTGYGRLDWHSVRRY